MTYKEEQKLLNEVYNYFKDCTFWSEDHTEFTIIGNSVDINISVSAAGWLCVTIENFSGNDYYAFPSEDIEKALRFISEELEK